MKSFILGFCICLLFASCSPKCKPEEVNCQEAQVNETGEGFGRGGIGPGGGGF